MFSMKVVILGAGRRGIRLARHLVEEHKDVVIVDHRATDVDNAMTSVDCLGVVASGTDVEDLRNAGIEDADAFIALTGSDETNLVSCGLVAAEFKIPITIAAVRNITYTAEDRKSNMLGITHIVNPSQAVASRIFSDIDRGLYSDIISFENMSLVLYNIYIDKKSKFKNVQLKKLRNVLPGQFVVAAVSNGSEVMVPTGDTLVREGDTLSIAINEGDVTEFFDNVGTRRHKPRKVVIIGTTMVTDFVLKMFTKRGLKNTTVISKDTEECRELALKYPSALIINENITNEGVFRREGIENYDLLISATDNDELNILVASYAKHYGVNGTIALINKNQDFVRMADHMDIDSLMSTQDITVDSIVRFLQGENVSTIHSMFDGRVEALEYTVDADCPLRGKMLKEINMKGKGLIVGAKKLDGRSILPGGNYCIDYGDKLLLVIERQSLNFIQRLLGMENTVI